MADACPHTNIRFCPLYLAAHMGNGHGCDDGNLFEQVCAVARGVSYRQKVEILRVTEPGLVELLEWSETAEQICHQRDRNRRLSGVH